MQSYLRTEDAFAYDTYLYERNKQALQRKLCRVKAEKKKKAFFDLMKSVRSGHRTERPKEYAQLLARIRQIIENNFDIALRDSPAMAQEASAQEASTTQVIFEELPFSTKEQCKSKAHTQPYFLKKSDFEKLIKNLDLTKHFPKPLSSYTKDELCDRLYEIMAQ